MGVWACGVWGHLANDGLAAGVDEEVRDGGLEVRVVGLERAHAQHLRSVQRGAEHACPGQPR